MQKCRVQQQDVRLERIGTGCFGTIYAQQTADRLQQREAITIGAPTVLLQRFRDRGNRARDVAEGQSGTVSASCFGQEVVQRTDD